MKKYTNIITLLMLVIFSQACSEDILNKTPLDKYSDATVWTDINLAKAYLNNCYSTVAAGWNGVMLGGITDELFNGRGGASVPYLLGAQTGDNLGASFGFGHLTWGNYSHIQKINLFLEKIDLVSEAYVDPEKSQVKDATEILKGEALFIRAWFYNGLARSYGGIPIMNKANKLGDDFSSIGRATFKETVDFIVKDCDDAAQLLKLKSEMEPGRVTKEAALALKSRILLFAASDLTADGTAANELVGYANPNRTSLWTAARDAAKAVMDLGTCELADFGAPDQSAVAKNYFEFFKAYDLSSKEVIWGKTYLQDIGTRHKVNETNGPNGNDNFGRNGPMQSMVDEYEMSDGSKFFDHFTVINDEYKNTSAEFSHENPYYNREPRFYASVLYDSALWQPRIYPAIALRDPFGIYDRRTRIVKQGGAEVSRTTGIDTRTGPQQNWNGCYGGYLTKKFMDDKIIGTREYCKAIWIYLRYAEIILNYAEACLELGDIPTATANINLIRNRAGLPDFTGEITEALRHERKVELFVEESRWYDIRRWKILEETLTPINYGIDITEIKDESTITTTWKRIVAQPVSKPAIKMYWMPIQTAELNRAPMLVQNPNY